jgi:ABC-2 type transport system ATP-binding protein
VTAALLLTDLCRSFGDRVAVDHLSLRVEPGEIYGLLGPNGAGKTTVIKLVTGLLRRDSGRGSVLGHDPERDPRAVRRRIGLVPQETNLYVDLSALHNLQHHAALFCDDLSAADRRIEQLLRLMELWERRNDRVRTWSGGMKRRLALARALVHDPDVIFFDEPTLGVDVQVRHALWAHVRALREQEGKTFVVSTNDMAEAEALCDRLVILDGGARVTEGSPDELRAALGRDIVTLRTHPALADPDALLAGLGPAVVTRPEQGVLRIELENGDQAAVELLRRIPEGASLESLRIARPTLDDVFLHHTGRGLRE